MFCRIYHPIQFLKLRSLLLCPLKSNTDIVNDFELKANNDQNEFASKNKEDAMSNFSVTTDHCLVSQKESESDHSQFMTNERESSVEASPILGIKKLSEEKFKKTAKDNHGKLNSNLESFNEIEEAFIRSLTRCVPWAARGGKSGSTFSKTTGMHAVEILVLHIKMTVTITFYIVSQMIAIF